MAIDYGTKKIGLALSDPFKSFVARTMTLDVKSDKDAALQIKDIVRQEQVSKIILGHPLNDDGSVGPMAEQVEQFKIRLEKLLEAEIILSDERYTSEEALKYLHMEGKKIEGNKKRIDAISAALILDDYIKENPA